MTTDSFTIGPESDPDKYRLLRQVGSGGEAQLWQATVRIGEAEETVAVKILRDVHALDPDGWRERWNQQVELLRLVRHVGVVGVHESFVGARMHRRGEADAATRHQYLVMNWVVGADLRQWMSSGGERAEALRYLLQIADVLDWLHDGHATPSGRPVVHGDISPGNVIVNPDGQSVLVDFGLSRIVGGVTGSSAGTQGFCAPEVLSAGEYGVAADRYAFGALTYFLLTGDNPPATAEELRQELCERVGPMFDGANAATVSAIAADDAQARPAAGEWLRGLRPHATTAVPRESPLPPPRHKVPRAATALAGAEKPRKVQQPWLVAGAAVAGMLVAFLMFGVYSVFTATPVSDHEVISEPSEDGHTSSETSSWSSTSEEESPSQDETSSQSPQGSSPSSPSPTDTSPTSASGQREGAWPVPVGEGAHGIADVRLTPR